MSSITPVFVTLLSVLLLVIGPNWSSLRAQSPLGVWKTIDDKNNKPASIIELYEEDGAIYGDILAILKEETKQANPMCVRCRDERKDQPVIGMQIIRDLKKDGELWTGGNVLDPHTGNIYKCYLELMEPDIIKVRGYFGFSIFGRTQYWYREPARETLNAGN